MRPSASVTQASSMTIREGESSSGGVVTPAGRRAPYHVNGAFHGLVIEGIC